MHRGPRTPRPPRRTVARPRGPAATCREVKRNGRQDFFDSCIASAETKLAENAKKIKELEAELSSLNDSAPAANGRAAQATAPSSAAASKANAHV